MYLRFRVKYIVLKELAMSSVYSRNKHLIFVLRPLLLSILFYIGQVIFNELFLIKAKEILL